MEVTSEIGIGSYIRDRELEVTSEIGNWTLHLASLFSRFSFVSVPRFDEGESAICGLRAVRGAPLISPQTENGKGPKPLALTQKGYSGFG